ncbi:uncharacterized protein DUF4156 [Allofrancisella inopinata]|uniref:DUF4156 domain-containing protein n=1 Tax=Allofrancisella inopinata TaxID=1085647 RepID=A0AAE7CQ41_9GAMM|nr:DUF4156 domain-containing protein [Allofrancisella inopinata]QIV95312.1 DUF4156 domain-containing protein [Allofrancisella inopinata]TDT69075.1 uncharacterized protein DUF4156 [Allofrancisella inopinata]
MNNKKILILLSVAIALSGCAANKLNPVAQSVQLSTAPAASDCKFINTITASQGNFFTGGFTSNNNLQTGAYNDIRNQAYDLGGNYIQLISSQAGNTGSMANGSGGYQQTNYSVTGSVYKCPEPKS